ncbi:MAG: hypothetical protein PHY16_07945 [Methylobacter sp.]|nr:hypothetical protein [Methylobacter sp.]
MRFKRTLSLIGILSLYSCAWNSTPPTPHQPNESVIPSREETVGLYSLIHKTIRDTERASYNLMYDIRDGVDNFIYDGQKEYYENYQK